MVNDTNIKGGRELDQLLQTLPAKMEKNVLRSGLRAGASVIKDAVVERIPVASGALRDSARITSRAKGAGVSVSVKVGNSQAWYAHLVEFGTRPHVIRPREAGSALQFGGVTTRAVQHPGTGARPFMRPALDASYSEALTAVTAKIRQRLTKQGIETPPALPADPEE
jgi:HK97 gp10 family phage protein